MGLHGFVDALVAKVALLGGLTIAFSQPGSMTIGGIDLKFFAAVSCILAPPINYVLGMYSRIAGDSTNVTDELSNSQAAEIKGYFQKFLASGVVEKVAVETCENAITKGIRRCASWMTQKHKTAVLRVVKTRHGSRKG